MKNLDLSLYLVTDSSLNPRFNLIELVSEAVQGGVTIVQLREKNKQSHEIVELGRALLKILKEKKIPLIVNDNPVIAKEIGASGVHLGANDTSPNYARQVLGKDAIIGLSIERLENFLNLDLSCVDYLAASPVFHTTTKGDIADPLGIEGLKQLRTKTSLPLVGIGGIHLHNASSVIAAGADGLAVVSAICNSDNPRRSAKEFSEMIRGARRVKAANTRVNRVLTIAGSDSGGGAGIQADLKTFEALQCYGMSAITALTAQNTKTVKSISAVAPSFVVEQIESVIEDIGVDAVKIGMLFSAEMITAVARTLERYKIKNIVLDPVMIAKSGDKLLQDSAVTALKECLLPLSSLVTPNLPEAMVLTGVDGIRDEKETEKASHELLKNCHAVILKGGHSSDPNTVKDFYEESSGKSHWITNPRVATSHTHGTGCTFSAAIAAYLASGYETFDAVLKAREYLQGAILSGATRKIGMGSGPVDHAWRTRGRIE